MFLNNSLKADSLKEKEKDRKAVSILVKISWHEDMAIVERPDVNVTLRNDMDTLESQRITVREWEHIWQNIEKEKVNQSLPFNSSMLLWYSII